MDLDHYSLTNNFNFYTALGSYMSGVELLGYFLVALLVGYVWAWYMIINEETTDFKVFSSEEEIEEFHKSCFHGMRKGIE